MQDRSLDQASKPRKSGPFVFLADPLAQLFCLATAVLATVGVTYHVMLWTCVDAAGLSCVSHKTPYWDFLNLWQGGRLALAGSIDVLFEPETWRQLLRQAHSEALPDSEWSYPPTMLLVGAPLSLLPLPVAYWVFTLGGVIALFFALRSLHAIPSWLCALACLTPLMFQNALLGQNGAYTTALLIGALSLAPRRPMIAGLLAGMLTIKPHLGVLIPFAWLAAGYWRAAFGAGAAVFAILGLSVVTFGVPAWTGFFNVTAPLMVAILEAPFPQHYHTQAFTVFVAARAMGADLAIAYGAQVISAVFAIAVTVRVWRPSSRFDHPDRVVVTAMLAPMVSPYAYTYDAIGVMVAIVWFAWKLRPPTAGLAGLALVMVAFNFTQLFNGLGYPFFVLVPLGMYVWVASQEPNAAQEAVRKRVTAKQSQLDADQQPD